jgi:phosphatidylglycerol:prolipoprotein diacylglycerol transferase
VGLILYTRRHRISAIAWADIAVVGLALGQFIGRWGNFFNQELYGSPSNLPWAVTIDPLHRLNEYLDVARFHPTFLYESLWSLATFLILLRLARRHRDKLQSGDLMALYLVLYSVGRIVMEFFRLDSRTLTLGGVDLGIPVATLVSIIIAVPMAILLIYRHLIAKNRQ